MRRIGIVLVLLLLGRAPMQSQNKYELRNLSPAQYMQAVPEIIEQASAEEMNFTFRRVIGQEFDLRYGDESLTTMSFDLLLDFQTALAIGADPSLPQDTETWFLAMLETGLRQEQMDNFPPEFDIGNFSITATPVDFDGDGDEEYLLEAHDNWSGRVFYTLFSDRLHSLPLPVMGMQSNVMTRALPQTGTLITRQLADIDGDGGTEWIVEANNYGYWASCGDLHVLDWQVNEIVNRTQNLFHYCIPLAQANTASVHYKYSQPNHIQMIETRIDGWNCQRARHDTLNLLTTTLTSTTTYADTVWCALREADDAFREGDYETAAIIYARTVSEFDGQMAQYLGARLALSYALDNQPERVHDTLSAIDATGQMGDLLLRLHDTSDDPATMCHVAFDFFADTNHLAKEAFDNPYSWTPEHFYFGHEPEDPRYFPLPIPSQAGCDYKQVMNSDPTPLPVEESPSDLQAAAYVQSGIYFALSQKKYQNVQENLETLLSSPTSDYEVYAQELVYWRAVTFEFMQQPNQALASYIAIYESAPESAWGMLAALHLKESDELSSFP